MNNELIEYYRNLLILQYTTKEKAIETIRAFVRSIMIFDVLDEIRKGFSIETAIGPQLDVLSLYVGASRYVPGTFFYRDYFGYVLYGDVAPFAFKPYLLYGEEIPDVQYRTYEESSQSDYAFNDKELRTIIKLRMIRNISNASLKDMDSFLLHLFDGAVYVDETNLMEINYFVPAASLRIFNLARAIKALPSPSGVEVFVTVI